MSGRQNFGGPQGHFNYNNNFNGQHQHPEPGAGYIYPPGGSGPSRGFDSFASYGKKKSHNNNKKDFKNKKIPFNSRYQDDIPTKMEQLKVKAPTGEHLSKTNSEVKNDPLFRESFFSKLADDLEEVPLTLKHFTGCTGLTPLINQLYDKLAADNINFKKSVPVSVFAYYCSCVTWARILYLRKYNKFTITALDNEFVDYFYSDDSPYDIPDLLHMYLSGIGNFLLPESQLSKFDVKACTLDANGYFVDMIARLYVTSSYPCVSIFAQRIMEDIARTADNNLGPVWTPNGLQRQWTERCIGYAPREILPDSEQLIFVGTNITATNFPTSLVGYRLNTSLLSKVNKYLKLTNVELLPLPKTHMGSVGQQILACASGVNANEVSIGDVSFVASSPVKQNKMISLMSGTFLYRVDKATTPARAAYFFPYLVAANQANLANLNLLMDDWPNVAVISNYYQNIGYIPNKRYEKYLLDFVRKKDGFK